MNAAVFILIISVLPTMTWIALELWDDFKTSKNKPVNGITEFTSLDALVEEASAKLPPLLNSTSEFIEWDKELNKSLKKNSYQEETITLDTILNEITSAEFDLETIIRSLEDEDEDIRHKELSSKIGNRYQSYGGAGGSSTIEPMYQPHHLCLDGNGIAHISYEDDEDKLVDLYNQHKEFLKKAQTCYHLSLTDSYLGDDGLRHPLCII